MEINNKFEIGQRVFFNKQAIKDIWVIHEDCKGRGCQYCEQYGDFRGQYQATVRSEFEPVVCVVTAIIVRKDNAIFYALPVYEQPESNVFATEKEAQKVCNKLNKKLDK